MRTLWEASQRPAGTVSTDRVEAKFDQLSAEQRTVRVGDHASQTNNSGRTSNQDVCAVVLIQLRSTATGNRSDCVSVERNAAVRVAAGQLLYSNSDCDEGSPITE